MHQKALVQLAKDAVELAKEEARLVQSRVEQGDLAPVEADRVAAAALSAESALLDAQNAMRQAEESLLLNIGMPLDTVLSLESWNDITLPEGSQLEEELKLVNEQNLGLIRQRKLIEAAELRLLDAKHARLPELNATTRLSATGWEEDLSDALVGNGQLSLTGSYID